MTNKITIKDEKEIFRKYNLLGRLLNKNLNDVDLKKTQRLRETLKAKIVENYTKLVYKIVHKHKSKFYNSNLDFQDVVQCGMVGLIFSIDHYDFNSSYAFSTYASVTVERVIYRYINETSRLIRIPERVVLKYLKNIKNDVETEDSEFIKTTVIECLFGNSFNSDGDTELSLVPQNVSPEDELDKNLISEDIKSAVETLPEKYKPIIYHYYGVCGKKQMTVKELGEFTGYSKKTIYTLIEEACEKMKKRKHMFDGWESYEEK